MKIFKRTVFSGVPSEYMAQPAEQCIIYYSKELPYGRRCEKIHI